MRANRIIRFSNGWWSGEAPLYAPAVARYCRKTWSMIGRRGKWHDFAIDGSLDARRLYRRYRDGLRGSSARRAMTRRRARPPPWSPGPTASPPSPINCDLPRSCQARAVAMCKGPTIPCSTWRTCRLAGDMAARARAGIGRRPLHLKAGRAGGDLAAALRAPECRELGLRAVRRRRPTAAPLRGWRSRRRCRRRPVWPSLSRSSR